MLLNHKIKTLKHADSKQKTLQSRASISSSRAISKTNLFTKTSSFDESVQKKESNRRGRYRKLLQLFINDGDPIVKAFDLAFPGLWNHEDNPKNSNGSDTAVVVSLMMTQFFNILTSIGITIFLTLDDFQVS